MNATRILDRALTALLSGYNVSGDDLRNVIGHISSFFIASTSARSISSQLQMCRYYTGPQMSLVAGCTKRGLPVATSFGFALTPMRIGLAPLSLQLTHDLRITVLPPVHGIFQMFVSAVHRTSAGASKRSRVQWSSPTRGSCESLR